MVIVQDKEKIVPDRGDFIEQGRQKRFGWRWLRRLKHIQHLCTHSWRNGLQRRHEVGQKTDWVAIGLIEGDPGYLPVASSDPTAEQGSFAKASRGCDEGQLAIVVQTLVQPLD